MHCKGSSTTTITEEEFEQVVQTMYSDSQREAHAKANTLLKITTQIIETLESRIQEIKEHARKAQQN